jgi:ubiquinone biosynthesis protein
MVSIPQLIRLLHINIVLVRHGLDEVVLAIHLFRPVRFVLYLRPWHWFRKTIPPRGVRIRQAFEDLGPIFVKFGQMLSTRRDLLPDDIADELAKLQDSVPPFPGDEACMVIEQAFGKPIDQIFTFFNKTPMASASIAQVHRALLADNTDVVVKVLRPGVEKIIRRDIGLLYVVATLAQRYSRDARRLRPKELVTEYERTILDELDLMREAANAGQLRRNFDASDELYIPEIYWPYTRKNVMVMERIEGIPISDIARLRAHADMHPGNIFVSYDHPENPQYLAVDFGIVGTLSSTDRRYLAENLVAFFNRDYRRVAELHLESGWVPSTTRVDEFESAIRTVCEPIFQRPLSEISLGHLLLRLFQTARRFNMEVQPQLVLLQKTLLNVEGLGRQLYPQLDLWQTAKPFLERWLDEQIGIRAIFDGFRRTLPQLAEHIPEIPELLFFVMKQAESEYLKAEGRHHDLREIKKEIYQANRRTVFAIVASAVLIFVGLVMIQ